VFCGAYVGILRFVSVGGLLKGSLVKVWWLVVIGDVKVEIADDVIVFSWVINVDTIRTSLVCKVVVML